MNYNDRAAKLTVDGFSAMLRLSTQHSCKLGQQHAKLVKNGQKLKYWKTVLFWSSEIKFVHQEFCKVLICHIRD